jgi:hypothetical protein
MTKAEMACCKKMAGECHMAAGKHPCCKTISTEPSPVVSVQPTAQFHPTVAVISLQAPVTLNPAVEDKSARSYLGLPPPAPPGLNSILRI